MLNYLLVIAVSLLAVALAGIITERHFIAILLAIELIFIASTIALVAFFSYAQSPDPSAVPMLIGIWAVASAEIITLITFYMYMKSKGFDFDVSKLSKLKW
jgi:NADH:ubiquinone oxidoreductase subunit K